MPIVGLVSHCLALSIVSPHYLGPGDTVTGASAWWGLRAYSFATVGTNAVRLRASGDNVESDFVTLTTGNLDVASISAFQVAHGGNLFITRVYDQSGGANHLLQATAAQQPQLILSGIGSLPVARFDGASTQLLVSTSNVTINRPFTMLGTMNRTANFTTQQNPLSHASGSVIFFPTSVNSIAFFDIGDGQSLSATDSVFHTSLATGSSGTENAYVDALTAGGAGVAPDLSGLASWGANSGGAAPFYGDSTEYGYWPSAFNATQASNMISNIRGYWGI